MCVHVFVCYIVITSCILLFCNVNGLLSDINFMIMRPILLLIEMNDVPKAKAKSWFETQWVPCGNIHFYDSVMHLCSSCNRRTKNSVMMMMMMIRRHNPNGVDQLGWKKSHAVYDKKIKIKTGSRMMPYLPCAENLLPVFLFVTSLVWESRNRFDDLILVEIFQSQ